MQYPCSENKDVDQLRCYREADLHLCFCRQLLFPLGGYNVNLETHVVLSFNIPVNNFFSHLGMVSFQTLLIGY